MSYLARSLVPIADTPFALFFFDLALKATVLLALATAGTALLRRSSAAVRHRIWCLTFASLLLLPGLSAALPQWRLAVLPHSSPLAPREESRPLAGQVTESRPAVRSPLSERSRAEEPFGLPLAEREDYYGLSPRAEEHTAPQPAPLAAWPRADVQAIWLAGALAALLPLIVGLLRIRKLSRNGRTIDDASWRDLLDQLRQRLALARRVALHEIDAPLMPMAWGVLRPVILLPREAHGWPDRLRRIVLLHELAHIKRFDVGFQLLGRVACAVYWFHPLAWYGLRRLRIDRELACDDCVIHAGERATDYAAELLHVARSYRRAALAAAVAMAQRNHLEHRLRALFDRACSHLPVSPRAARLLLGGVLAFVTTIAAVRLAPRAADADDAAQPAIAQPPSAVAAADADDLVTVSGTVVDPQGKPFAGAKLYAVRWYWEPHIPHPPLAETTSDAQGRFTISYRKSQFTVDVRQIDGWKDVSIVATADDLGMVWVTWSDISHGKEPTLRLVPDDVPIAGRVVDLEGRPVAGVNVRVGNVLTAKGGNLDAWLAAIRQGEFPQTAFEHLDQELPQFDGWPPRVVTGDDGQFRIPGVGRERCVHLSFTGPSIAYRQILVTTRRAGMFPLKFNGSEQESELIYGARFELVAPPTQPITGVVRDAETHQPLAGVSIESNTFAGSHWINTRYLRAVSDEQGRYRLVGMPKGAGNHILAVPNDDQPYLMRNIKVPESRGLEPVGVDIDLHRGIWITGRVTDRTTGKPLIAWLHYLPFWTNEYAQKTPEFGKPRTPDGYDTRYVSRPDGSYRLVGLPGRAVVGAESILGRYRAGVGAESIAGMQEDGCFRTYPNPIEPGKKWPHAMKEINPLPGTEQIACDLALDPGEKLTVNVLDPDGKSLAGFQVQGSGLSWTGSHNSHDLHRTVDVITLGPEETRTVIIRHKERKLGKVIRVRLAEHASGSLSVRLEPTARIVGRFTDREGTPISGAAIQAWIQPNGNFSQSLSPTATDGEGRFEYTDIPTGCRYNLNAEAAGMKPFGSFAEDIAVAPGETKDLGDVIYGGKPVSDGDAAARKSGGVNESRGEPIDFSGRMIGPDGRPVAEARVWLMRFAYGFQPDDDKLRIHSRTRADGSFALRVPAEAAFGVSGWCVVGTTQGYGPGWTDLEASDQTSGLTLKLAREAPPVEGRVIDMEGRPVVGMKVQVLSLHSFPDGNPRPYLDSLQRGEEFQFTRSGVPADRPGDDRLIEAAKTDAQGNFKLYGIGQNRLAWVTLVGGGVEHTMIEVITHAVPEGLQTPDHAPFSRHVYGNRFTHVARPSRAIVGMVTNAETDEPIAGAIVQSFPGWANVVTRSDGRFSLSGCPKADEYRLLATISETGLSDTGPYIGGSATLRDNRGLEPLEVKLHLYPAVRATGRVIDRATGRPVAADVDYYPLYPNKHDVAGIADSGARAHGQYSEGHTDRDGRFSLAVLPGPGCLCVKAVNGERYEPAQVDIPAFLKKQGITVDLEGAGQAAQLLRASDFPDNKEVLFTGSGGGKACAMQQSQFHAIALFNVAEGAEKVVQSIELKLKHSDDAENGGE